MVLQALRKGVDVQCHIELDYDSEKEAEKVLRAVSVDNEGFVTAKRTGRSVISEIHAKSIMGLLHTIEDYLACVSVAERTFKETRDTLHVHGRPHPSRSKASRRGS